MIYRRLADLVVAVHALISLFFLIGGVICWRYPAVAVVHIPLAVWVTASFIAGWTCPLTPLENHLRRAAGDRGYDGGFIEHYLARLVARPSAGPDESPAEHRQAEFAVGVLFGGLSFALHAVNIAPYRDALARLTS